MKIFGIKKLKCFYFIILIYLFHPFYSMATMLPLDSRFVQAISSLNQKVNPQKKIEIIIEKDKYIISSSDKEKVNNPSTIIYEFSDVGFYNLFEALKITASNLLDIDYLPAENRELNLFEDMPISPTQLISIAKSTNSTALSNIEDLNLLTQSLILLNYFVYDELDEMDVIKSDSLMLLALYEVKSGTTDEALLMMLAQNLGYELYAEHLALKMPYHPLSKFYSNGEITGFSDFSDMLRIKKATTIGDVTTWTEAVNRLNNKNVDLSFMLYNLKSIEAYNIRSKLLLLYPLIIYSDYLYNNKAKSVLFTKGKIDLNIDNISLLSKVMGEQLNYEPSKFITYFSEKIAQESIFSEDGVLNSKVFVNYWKSQLFNSYYSIANYLTKIEPEEKLSRSLLEILDKNKATRIGKLLNDWYQVIVSKDYEQSVDSFFVVAGLNNSNIKLLGLLYDSQYDLLPTINTNYLESHYLLLSKLDSRYQQQTMRFKLNAEFQKIDSSTINLDEYSHRINGYLIEGLDYLKDIDSLRKALNLTKQVDEKAAILALIFKYYGGNEQDLSQLQNLYDENRRSFFILNKYINVLLTEGKTKKAISLLNDFIQQNLDLSFRDYLDLAVLIAQASIDNGDIDAAWNTVYPMLSSQYSAITLVAIDILIIQDNIEDAEKLLRDYQFLYPKTNSALEYELKLLFIKKEFTQASKIINNWHYSLDEAQFNQYVLKNLDMMLVSEQAQKDFLGQLKSDSKK